MAPNYVIGALRAALRTEVRIALYLALGVISSLLSIAAVPVALVDTDTALAMLDAAIYVLTALLVASIADVAWLRWRETRR